MSCPYAFTPLLGGLMQNCAIATQVTAVDLRKQTSCSQSLAWKTATTPAYP